MLPRNVNPGTTGQNSALLFRPEKQLFDFLWARDHASTPRLLARLLDMTGLSTRDAVGDGAFFRPLPRFLESGLGAQLRTTNGSVRGVVNINDNGVGGRGRPWCTDCTNSKNRLEVGSKHTPLDPLSPDGTC